LLLTEATECGCGAAPLGRLYARNPLVADSVLHLLTKLTRRELKLKAAMLPLSTSHFSAVIKFWMNYSN